MQYVDLNDIGLTFVEVGTDNTTSNYGGNAPAPTACIVNGKLSYFYNSGTNSNPVTSNGAKLLSIDSNGDMCIYKTPDLKEPFVGYGQIGQRGFSDSISISGNTIRWSFTNSATYEWTIPPLFFPNTTLIVNYSETDKPPPCGTGDIHKTIITKDNISYEFIKAFPESDDYWVSIYDLNGNIVNSGYIGNSPIDLFDRTTNNLPPYVDGSWLRNGYNVYNTDGAVSYPSQVFGWYKKKLVQNNVPLSCVTPNVGTYVYSTDISKFYLSEYGIPEVISSQGVELNSICDIEGAFIQQLQQSGKGISTLFFNKDYYVSLSANQGHHFFPSMINGKIYAYIQNVNGEGIPQVGGKIYVATNNPLTPYGPKPIITSDLTGYSLINMSRPVSPLGAFRT